MCSASLPPQLSPLSLLSLSPCNRSSSIHSSPFFLPPALLPPFLFSCARGRRGHHLPRASRPRCFSSCCCSSCSRGGRPVGGAWRTRKGRTWGSSGPGWRTAEANAV
uniref:p2C10 n=1 Tax=Arundo donax TaxID=35708 RepID=A0A0A9CNH6_ARUDO